MNTKDIDRLKSLGKSIRKSLQSRPSKSLTQKQVVKKFVHKYSRQEIVDVIDFLVIDKQIKVVQGNRYQYNDMKKKKLIVRKVEGKVDLAPSGVAYIFVDGLEEDVRVEKSATGNVLQGDKVLVGLYKTSQGNRPKGEIIEIIERSQEFFIGNVELGNDFAFVVPDKRKMQHDFFINKENINGAKNGDKVVVQFLDWQDKRKNPNGKIIEILGKSGVHDVEMKGILIEQNFPLHFSEHVQKELDQISTNIPEEEAANRKDMRDVLTFTIDPVDAKDFDDAISYQELADGKVEIGVHIADVSHYVQPNTALDKEGYRRATSVYLVDRVLPMLPEKLSNIVCSLRPDEDSLCFAVLFTMKEDKIISYSIEKTIIYSDKRFTYDEALEEINKGTGKFGKPLAQINAIAKLLKKNRFEKGSINFDSRELRFTLNDDQQIEAVNAKVRHDAHFLVEEFMLLANQSVAKYIKGKLYKKQQVPFVFRIHDEPDPEKLNTFAMNAADFGHKIHTDNLKKLPFEINRFFEEIKGSPEQHNLESLAIRSMAKAIYSTDNIGHYGLGFSDYSHFTSPIRRYPDLMVHRQLHAFLSEGKIWEDKTALEERCNHCSDMEKRASDAERESIKYFQTVYMHDKVGETFTGVVTGVTSWGVYVEISDVFTEGLVRLDTMKDDRYEFDEKRKQIVGLDTGKVFHLGTTMKVVVDKVSVEKRQIDLSYLV